VHVSRGYLRIDGAGGRFGWLTRTGLGHCLNDNLSRRLSPLSSRTSPPRSELVRTTPENLAPPRCASRGRWIQGWMKQPSRRFISGAFSADAWDTPADVAITVLTDFSIGSRSVEPPGSAHHQRLSAAPAVSHRRLKDPGSESQRPSAAAAEQRSRDQARVLPHLCEISRCCLKTNARVRVLTRDPVPVAHVLLRAHTGRGQCDAGAAAIFD